MADNIGMKPKKGLKIDNQGSSVPDPKEDPSIAFDKQANAAFDKYVDYKQRMAELVVQFKAMIEDKVLPENKGSIAKNMEEEVLKKLVAVASEMNEDAAQPESVGGTALCMLLMKMMLAQRDHINQMDYKIDAIKNVVKKQSE